MVPLISRTYTFCHLLDKCFSWLISTFFIYFKMLYFIRMPQNVTEGLIWRSWNSISFLSFYILINVYNKLLCHFTFIKDVLSVIIINHYCHSAILSLKYQCFSIYISIIHRNMALNHQFNFGLIKNPYFPPINLLYFKMEMEMLCNNTRIHGWNHSKR